MSLSIIFRYLSQVPYLSAIAFVGGVLTLGSSNRALSQASAAVTFASGGAAIATMMNNNKLQDAQQIQQDYYLDELQALKTAYEQRENSLKTFLDMAMAEGESLKGRIAQMNAVLADDQLEKVSIFSEFQRLETEYHHLLFDLQLMAIAEAEQAAQVAHIQATSQAEITQLKAQAHTRITALETTLADKTNMATQMLTELEAEATGTFNQFTAKVASQGELIEKLYQQIESLKQTNAALNRKQIDRQIGNIGSTDLMGNSLFGRQTMRKPS